jgi:hypothetical protein
MLKMVNHQFKVLQSVVATLIEGGRGVMGTPFPNQPENQSSFMNLKVHHFATCS